MFTKHTLTVKRLLALLLLCWWLPLQATNVLVPLATFVSASTNRTINVTRASVPDVNNGSVILGDVVQYRTGSTNSFTITNAPIGLYSASVLAPPTRTDFKFYVQATNLGTISVTTIMVDANATTYPAGSIAWSAASSDLRYAASAGILTNYVTQTDLSTATNAVIARLGSAAYAPTNQFYPANNPSNFITAAITNGYATTNQLQYQGTAITNSTIALLAAQGTATTNNLAAQGVATTNGFAALGLNATNFTKLVGLSLTNFILATSNSLATAFGSSTSYQPTSQNLTNWSAHGTNDYFSTSLWQSFSNALGSVITYNVEDFQPTSTVLSSLVTYGTNFWYPRFNPSNFVSASVTNGLVGNTQLMSATNLSYLASQPTNNVLTLLSLFGTNFWYPRANPSNFVTVSVTNILGTAAFLPITDFQPTSTVLTAFATFGTNYFYPRFNPSNFVDASITNGLYPSSNPSGYVTASVTNGLYPSSNPAGYITTAGTNGLATIVYVNSSTNTLYGITQPSNSVLTSLVTFGTNFFYPRFNPSNFVTATITNGLASTNYVNTATNTFALLAAAIYYPKSNPSNFVSQTIFATNNPSNIVCTLPSRAFWTNGAEWACVVGSNWFPTVLP